jgi:hypothetical protein
MRSTTLPGVVSLMICVFIILSLSACATQSYTGQAITAPNGGAVPTAQVISRPPEQPREVRNPLPTASTTRYTVQSSDAPAEAPVITTPAEHGAVEGYAIPTAQVIGRPPEQPREVVIPTPVPVPASDPGQS